MKKADIITPITTDVQGIMAMFGIGRNTARKIGEEAGAVIRISTRRTLYSVEKIRTYMESKAGGREDGRG